MPVPCVCGYKGASQVESQEFPDMSGKHTHTDTVGQLSERWGEERIINFNESEREFSFDHFLVCAENGNKVWVFWRCKLRWAELTENKERKRIEGRAVSVDRSGEVDEAAFGV